jgi:glutathione S-transferase
MIGQLRLHYAPDNASLCVRLALEELGLRYETALVDRAARGHKSAAYLALNPNGLIPVLETADGPVYETAAILLWLADRAGTMMPGIDAPERAHAMQWLMWLANSLHPALRMMFYPDQYYDGAAEDLRAPTRRRIIAMLDVLEAARDAPWLDDDTPSIHGCYLGPMLRWLALYGGDTAWFDLGRWRRLRSFARRTEIRPAVTIAARAEGLGPLPFSAPQPCNPPEGSAL